MEEQRAPGAWAHIKRAFPTLWMPYFLQFGALTLLNFLLAACVLASGAAMCWFLQVVGIGEPASSRLFLWYSAAWTLAAFVSALVGLIAACRAANPCAMARAFTVLVLLELAGVCLHLMALCVPLLRIHPHQIGG
jgi:hypothetical protein